MGILLLQPRHTYAPKRECKRLGHVYMPTSILCAAARLLNAGLEVRVADENLDHVGELSSIVGVNLIGAPYILRGIEVGLRLKQQYPNGIFLVGGQVVSGLSHAQRQILFGDDVVNGNDDSSLSAALGLRPGQLPSSEETSLCAAYKLLPDDAMRMYLENEFSFYLSQGCRFRCTFCPAERTRTDLETGKLVLVRERYRKPHVVRSDLDYLIAKAASFGIMSLQIYLSNLDLFQTPDELAQFASIVHDLRRKYPQFVVRMRALSTVKSFLTVHETNPYLIANLVEAGLYKIGFGVDGATPAVWRAVRKPQDGDACLNAIRISREEYGITPETLMVFGHNEYDDRNSLRIAVDFTKAMGSVYGAVPRPHVAKDMIPGNDGWFLFRHRGVVEYLLKNPQAFQLLDFTSLPSWLTHPDARFREAVSESFIEICKLPGSITQFVLPEDPELDDEELQAAKDFNQERYDI